MKTYHSLISHLQNLCHLLILLFAVLLTACSSQFSFEKVFARSPKPEPLPRGPFATTVLVEQIDRFYGGVNPGPIGVATFVNLDDLYTTSTFGRMLAEQIMSDLTIRGYDIVELRHADALQFINREGELVLSRDTSVLRRHQDLGGIVVGTYVVSPVKVYVNARLINPSTSMILSAGYIELDKTNEIARLLRNNRRMPTLERIPVRHLALRTYPAYAFKEQYVSYGAEEESVHVPLFSSGKRGQKK